jgi:hypothetical protein
MTDWQVDAKSVAPPERYAKLGLSRNPFSASGLAPENPPGLPVSAVRQDLERFVASFLQTGSYQAAVLVGPYGSGKTHHMRLLEKLFRSDPATRVVYLASAQNDPRQVVEAVLKELGRGDLAKLVWRPVLETLRRAQTQDPSRIFAEFGDEKIKARRPRNSVAIFPDVVFSDDALGDYRRLIVAFQERRDLSLKKLRTYAISTLSKHLNISAGSARLLFDTTEDEALRAAGAADQLFSGPAKEPAAEEAEVLRGLSQLLTEDGTTRLVLLIDEFEGVSMLERMTRRQSVDYLYSLRMLVDRTAPSAPYALVVATTPQAYDLARDLYSPTESRFQWQIKLPILDESTAREILTTALASARLPKARDGIRPFTDEFLQALLATGISVPRALIVKAHRAIERAAEDQKVTAITAEIIPQLGD